MKDEAENELEKKIEKNRWFRRFSPKRTYEVILPSKRNWISLGLIGDTHLTSKFCDEGAIRAYYRDMQRSGIHNIFHAGDVWDGCCGDVQVYRGQVHDSNTTGFNEGIYYVADNYPKLKHMKTHFILGNHDARIMEVTGADFGKALQNIRPDMHYLQPFYARALLSKNPQLALDLIHLAGGVPYCYDEETEILTKDGFVLFKELNGNEEVAVLIGNEYLEWKKPNEVIKMNWEGDMIEFKGQAIDMLVTPNHKMLVRTDESKWKNTGWIIKTAEEMEKEYVKNKWRMKRNCKWRGEDIELWKIDGKNYHKRKQIDSLSIEPFLEFLGWYISEGWTYKPGRIYIAQQNEKNRKEIIRCFERLGFTPTINKNSIEINHKQLKQYIDKLAGRGSRNKHIDKKIKELSPRLLKILLTSMFKGDGSLTPSRRWFVYTTISKQLADDVQECLLKIGKVSSLYYRKGRGLYEVIVGHERSLEPRIRKKPKIIQYKGKIYCVDVNDGTIFTRRNGKTIWGKNTIGYAIQKYIRNVPPSKRADIYGFGHCLSEDTEILTKNGWKFFDELIDDEEVMTSIPNTEFLEWNKIEKIWKHKNFREHIVSKHRFIDISVTPKHRMVLKNLSGKWVEIPANELLTKKNFKIKVSGLLSNKGIKLNNNVIELIGWIISEGSMRKYGLKIYQEWGEHKKITKLIDKIGLKYSIYRRKFQGRQFFDKRNRKWYTTKNDEADVYIWENDAKILKKILKNKKDIPDEFLEMSNEQFGILLNGLVGDGHWIGKSFHYYTSDESLANNLQILAITHGYRCMIKQRRGQFELYMNPIQYQWVNYGSQKTFSKKPYKGISWCVTVKNGTIMIRRNGKVCIVGNTHHHQHVSAEGDDESFLVGGWQTPSEYNIRRGAGSSIGGYKLRVKLATNPGSNPMDKIEGTFMRYD